MFGADPDLTMDRIQLLHGFDEIAFASRLCHRHMFKKPLDPDPQNDEQS